MPEVKARNFLNFLIVLSIIRYSNRANHSVILDQGIFQAAWSLCQNSLPIEDQKYFILKLIGLVRSEINLAQMLIINLEINVTEITDRLVKRGGGESSYDQLLSDVEKLSRRVAADDVLFKSILRDSSVEYLEVPQESARSSISSAIKGRLSFS